METYGDQPGRPHPLGQRFALRKLAHALGQVVVSRLPVAGQPLADPRQHVLKIPAIQPVDHGPAGHGKLQHGDVSTGPAHPHHLGQTPIGVAHVAQSEGHAHDLEQPVGKRQPGGVAFHQPQPPAAGPLHLVPGDLQHGPAEVQAHHHRSGRAGPHVLQRQVGRAGAQVQDRGLSDRGNQFDRAAAPAAIDAQRQQMVEPVVARGNLTEHAADARRIYQRSCWKKGA